MSHANKFKFGCFARKPQATAERLERRSRLSRQLNCEVLERRELMAADLLSSREELHVHMSVDVSREVANGTYKADELVETLRRLEELESNQGSSKGQGAGKGSNGFGTAATGDMNFAVLSSPIPAALAPLSIPIYNSLPGAAKSLYLDFDGNFEATWGGYSNVTTPAFDIDGDPASLGATELTYIESVWRQVAEDYAPFNINVTTVEPTVLAAGAPAAAKEGVALRAAIGGSDTVLGVGAGVVGMAFISGFTGTGSNTALVFPFSSSSTTARNSIVIGATAAHEAGHTLGLNHLWQSADITTSSQAIMSPAVYGFEDVFWSSGVLTTGGVQDDMAVLATGASKLGYRTDDVANNIGGATPLNFDGAQWSGSGLISTTTDVDVWSLNSSSGRSLKLSVTGSVVGQNLDAVIDLLDAGGNVLSTMSPTDTNDATLYFEANGARYVRVRSTGEYGRVGQYTISTADSTPSVLINAAPLLMTSESGTAATVVVALSSKPSADVAIQFASSNPAEGTLSNAQLTFTSSNWYLPQLVTVQGVNDSAIDGAQSFEITATVASSDTNFEAMSVPSRTVVNADNDTPGWMKQIEVNKRFDEFTYYDLQAMNDGTLIATGTFSGTVDFDPGVGTTTLTSRGNIDGVVAKYTPAGELIWANRFGGSDGNAFPGGLLVDAGGNIYIGWMDSGSAPTVGSISLTGKGSNDAYLAKLNANGVAQWAVGWGGTGSDSLNDMEFDAAGNVVVAGEFSATVDFNPAKATLSKTSTGGSDAYISRITPAGVFSSVTTFGGVNSDTLRSLEIDSSGNAYATGSFSTSTVLGGQTLTSVGSSDSYLLKASPTGTINWVRQALSDGSTFGNPLLALSSTGRLIWSASLLGNVNFGAGTPTLSSPQVAGFAMTEWTTAGALVQTGLINSPNTVSVSEMQFDAQGRLLILGRARGTIDLDPTAGTTWQSIPGATADFVLRLNGFQYSDAFMIPHTAIGGASRTLAFDSVGNITAASSFLQEVASPGGQVLRDNSPSLASYLVRVLFSPLPVTLFADSFEVSEWNGLWVEDSQNDWALSTQRASSGNKSAEIDGLATNATLTLANSVNVLGYATQVLTFDWLIESDFDAGEYLALDISRDNGKTWISDVRRLSGNVSPENTWVSESIDLTPYVSNGLKVRFRATASDTVEDANVDNVKIVATFGTTGASSVAAPSIQSFAISSMAGSKPAISSDQPTAVASTSVGTQLIAVNGNTAATDAALVTWEASDRLTSMPKSGSNEGDYSLSFDFLSDRRSDKILSDNK